MRGSLLILTLSNLDSLFFASIAALTFLFDTKISSVKCALDRKATCVLENELHIYLYRDSFAIRLEGDVSNHSIVLIWRKNFLRHFTDILIHQLCIDSNFFQLF